VSRALCWANALFPLRYVDIDAIVVGVFRLMRLGLMSVLGDTVYV
jgi:hypothetical protein